MIYLQQITPYVDTKDYEFRGLDQRIVEDVAELQAHEARALRGLAAAITAVSDRHAEAIRAVRGPLRAPPRRSPEIDCRTAACGARA